MTGGNRPRPSRQSGRLLAELAVAIGIAAAAFLGVAAILPLAARAREVAQEKGIARRAAERRLAEVAALDDDGFRGFFAGAGAEPLRFAVEGLGPPPDATQVGALSVAPPPGSAAFDEASVFEVAAVCRWRGADGVTAIRIAVLHRPRPRPGAGP